MLTTRSHFRKHTWHQFSFGRRTCNLFTTIFGIPFVPFLLLFLGKKEREKKRARTTSVRAFQKKSASQEYSIHENRTHISHTEREVDVSSSPVHPRSGLQPFFQGVGGGRVLATLSPHRLAKSFPGGVLGCYRRESF